MAKRKEPTFGDELARDGVDPSRLASGRDQPGDDQEIDRGAEITVLNAVREFKREAEAARKTRLEKNRRNYAAFNGEQDFSYKQPGQSKEQLPKVAMATEQISAFFKRALTDFGDWFDMELPRGSVISNQQARRYLKCKLEHLSRVEEDRLDFPTLLGDASKVGLLASTITLKVHGRQVKQRKLVAERGVKYVEVPFRGQTFRQPQQTHRLREREIETWQLLIDLVRPEDFLQDPTGRGLYRIHSVERDLAEVIDAAEGEDAIYDPEAVARIEEDFAKQEDATDMARQQNQDVALPPSFRKRVVIDEFWGTLLDSRGRIVARNVVCAVANDKYLIRPPEPNPFWHGQSPFVTAALLRVPFSVHHKALMDHATALNVALNELFNLMLDGGMASVWGTRQIKASALEDPRQISKGIPQGMTLVVKEEFPNDAMVMKRVDTGEVPRDSMLMFGTLDRELQGATAAPELRMGQLPAKQVKATEVIEASQNSSMFFDGMVRDTEDKLIEPTLWKAWVTIMQHADDLDSEEVVKAIGPRAALALARMSPAERYATLAQGCSIRVHGLSSVLARARDFAKLVAFMQAAASNPLLLRAFLKRFSENKIITKLAQALNLNPEDIERDEEEQMDMGQQIGELEQLTRVTGSGGQGRGGSLRTDESGGNHGAPAEINQQVNPLSGLTANA